MPKYSFRVFWSDSDKAFIVTCPEFPGLSAFGNTEEEALREAKIALEMFVEDMQESGESLPEPLAAHQYSGQTRLRLAKSLHRAAAEMAEAEGQSLNQFISDAVRDKVTGEQVASRAIAGMQKELNQNALAWASGVMNLHSSRVTHTVKTIKVDSTEETVSLPSLTREGRRYN